MANVLIRDVPDEVIAELKQLAARHNRSLQQELWAILVRGAMQPHVDVGRRAAEIREKLAGRQDFGDSVELLREDRKR